MGRVLSIDPGKRKCGLVLAEISEKKVYKAIILKSEFIGETVLSHLKEINKVAYLRFASVYKEFSDASDFEKEVAEL